MFKNKFLILFAVVLVALSACSGKTSQSGQTSAQNQNGSNQPVAQINIPTPANQANPSAASANGTNVTAGQTNGGQNQQPPMNGQQPQANGQQNRVGQGQQPGGQPFSNGQQPPQPGNDGQQPPLNGQQTPRQGNDGQQPPQAALDACSTLTQGATCSINTPNGSLNGTCMTPPNSSQLACVPAGGPPTP